MYYKIPLLFLLILLFTQLNCSFMEKMELKELAKSEALISMPLLLAYFSFENQLNNLSQNNSDGFLYFNNQYYFIPNPIYDRGPCINFVNNYVMINDNQSVNFNQASFSMSFWIKTSADTGTHTIIDKRVVSDSHITGYQVLLREGRIVVVLGDGSTDGLNSNGYWEYFDNTQSYDKLSDYHWKFIEITIDRSNSTNQVSAYSNGNLLFSENNSIPTGSISNNGEFFIGKNREDYLASSFDGKLDELIIYDGIITSQRTPILYLPFDDHLQDMSSNQNNGTLFINHIEQVLPYQNGPYGNSFLFHDNYVKINNPSQLKLNNQAFSITFWIKTDTVETKPILDKMNDQSKGYCLKLVNGRLTIELGDGSLFTEFTNGNSRLLNDNSWHFVKLLVDLNNHKIKLVIDHTSMVEFNNIDSFTDINNYTPLYIGKFTDNTISFSGYLDEIKIYDGLIP